MKKDSQPLTIERIRAAHRRKRREIRKRLREIENIWKNATDELLFEEMVFCFFTGGCSAKMGLRSVESGRPFLSDGSEKDIARALTGAHRYPNARARYVVHTRDFLTVRGELDLRKRLQSFRDSNERRDWLVREKGIKGLGYKEASHFLRNIGFKGYGILDKHVLNSLAELKLIDDPKPPNTRSKYLMTENSLRKLTDAAEIDFDELDLVLWSMKTGMILK